MRHMTCRALSGLFFALALGSALVSLAGEVRGTVVREPAGLDRAPPLRSCQTRAPCA